MSQSGLWLARIGGGPTTRVVISDTIERHANAPTSHLRHARPLRLALENINEVRSLPSHVDPEDCVENEPIHLTREGLYEQVWAEPMMSLAKKYGLSDVGLAKICIKQRIPRPGLGYWRKEQVGIKVRQMPPAES